MTNISAFEDTMQCIRRNAQLNQRTKQSIMHTQIFPPNSHSKKHPHYESPEVTVTTETTVSAARRLYRAYTRLALLNFANPLEPGGGVLRGATAQEESICRASTLYPCLTSTQASAFYELHRSIPYHFLGFLATDSLLYSPGVTLFKEEDENGVPLYTERWCIAEVITCAAPCFYSRMNCLPDDELLPLFTKRIKNIMEAAIDHDIASLILGAFGCGAFRNPPLVVAEAFRQVLLMPRYRYAFAHVCFAIRRSNSFCENVEAFEIKMSAFPEEALFSPERNKRRFFE